MISTQRLTLVPATPQLTRWEMRHHAELSAALNATIPDAWPPVNLRDALDFFAGLMEAAPDNTLFVPYYWLSNAEHPGNLVLVGSGGFKGAPDETGTVEVGYGTLNEFQGRGYATEATNALVAWALSQPTVKHVIAEALIENLPSVRVLEKCGFTAEGVGSEPDVVRFRYRVPDR